MPRRNAASKINDEIRAKMGDAEIARLDGYVITNKTQHRKAFEETSFRKLHVKATREKIENGPF